MGSKVGVLVCQLKGDSWEDTVQVAAVLEIARTKEGRSKASSCEEPLCDSLSDCRFPSAGLTIQPEHRRLVEVLGPGLDLVQHRILRPSETSTAVPVTVFCSLCATKAV